MERLTGGALADRVEELAVLRLAVLGEFPYLYSGSAAYEERYLSDLGGLPGGLILAAFERNRMVAAVTGAPLDQELDALRDPFTHAGCAPRSIFYFGEGVVLPSHRGRGIGTTLLEIGESHIRDTGGFASIAFGEIVHLVLLNWKDVTGGGAGILSIPKIGLPAVHIESWVTLFGMTLPKFAFFNIKFDASPEGFAALFGLPISSAYYKIFLYYLILILAFITAFATSRMRKLPVGRA